MQPKKTNLKQDGSFLNWGSKFDKFYIHPQQTIQTIQIQKSVTQRKIQSFLQSNQKKSLKSLNQESGEVSNSQENDERAE